MLLNVAWYGTFIQKGPHIQTQAKPNETCQQYYGPWSHADASSDVWTGGRGVRGHERCFKHTRLILQLACFQHRCWCGWVPARISSSGSGYYSSNLRVTLLPTWRHQTLCVQPQPIFNKAPIPVRLKKQVHHELNMTPSTVKVWHRLPFICSRLDKESNMCLGSRGREYVLVCDAFSPPFVC